MAPVRSDYAPVLMAGVDEGCVGAAGLSNGLTCFEYFISKHWR